MLVSSLEVENDKQRTYFVQVTGGGQSYRYHVDRKDLAEVTPAGQVKKIQNYKYGPVRVSAERSWKVGRGGGELGRKWGVGLLGVST